MLLQVWDEMDADEHFASAWQLLEEEERKRHLLKGLERACQHGSWGQDSRALCPEITITSMLKQRGQAFIDLINIYKTGKKDIDGSTPYCFPSEWWAKAMEDATPSLSVQITEFTFELLTLHRNEFMCEPNAIRHRTYLTTFVYSSVLHGGHHVSFP